LATSFRRCDDEIREVPAAFVAYPQPDLATIELAKLSHFERGLVAVADIDLHSAASNDHAELDPIRGLDRGIDWVFKLLWEGFAKAVIVEPRQREVLDRVLMRT
jgi:hypothetical protein